MKSRAADNVEKLAVGQLNESELADADRIVGDAFGMFLGEDPETFMEGRELVHGRYAVDREGVLALRAGSTLIGSNVLTRWGSFGWFGPLTIDPAYWGQGGAQRLLEQSMDTFQRWGCRAVGLYTFANSAKHLHLYQKFDFWPRFLTAVMSKPTSSSRTQPPARGVDTFSEMSPVDREACLASSLELTNALYEGLDLRREIESTTVLGQGDSVWLRPDSQAEGFAVCQFGQRSEARPGTCYVKFAAIRPGPAAPQRFEELLDACTCFAARKSLATIAAGMNFERRGAYHAMLRHGFLIDFTGVQMFRYDERAYNRPDTYVIDDLH